MARQTMNEQQAFALATLLRQEQGSRTQKAYAEDCHIDPNKLSRLLNSKNKVPPTEEELRILFNDSLRRKQAVAIISQGKEVDTYHGPLSSEDCAFVKELLGSEPSADMLRRAESAMPFIRREQVSLDALECLAGGDAVVYAELRKHAAELGCNEDELARFAAITNRAMRPLDVTALMASSGAENDAKKFSDIFLLDPANPRLESENETHHPADVLKQETQDACRSSLDKDSKTLADCIRTSGYSRTNPIIVVSLYGAGAPPYVAIEGNTRLAAIRKLLDEQCACTGNENDLGRMYLDVADLNIQQLWGYSYSTVEPLRADLLLKLHVNGTKAWSLYAQSRTLAKEQKKGRNEKRLAGSSRNSKVNTDINAYEMLRDAIERMNPEKFRLSQDHKQRISLFKELTGKAAVFYKNASEDDKDRFLVWTGVYVRQEADYEASLDSANEKDPAPAISGTHLIKKFSHLLEQLEGNERDKAELFQALDEGTPFESLVAKDINLKTFLNRTKKSLESLTLAQLMRATNIEKEDFLHCAETMTDFADQLEKPTMNIVLPRLEKLLAKINLPLLKKASDAEQKQFEEYTEIMVMYDNNLKSK